MKFLLLFANETERLTTPHAPLANSFFAHELSPRNPGLGTLQAGKPDKRAEPPFCPPVLHPTT
jgi:hypothetical protein